MLEKSSDKILCVDDEDNILHLFKRSLGRKFQLFTANSAENALQILREHTDIAVILSDYNMPIMNGVEFLKKAETLAPDSIQIMLTGNIELDVAINAINETNIFRYLPKPCPMPVIQKVIGDALAQYYLKFEKARLTRQLQEKNEELADSNKKLAKQKYLLEYELETAKIVYSKINSQNTLLIDGIECFIAAKSLVGGDFILTHSMPEHGVLYLMLGDLTGHGLQSALSVLLVHETFENVCYTLPSVEQLAESINDKMFHLLPVDLFCAAVIFKIEINAGVFHLWQGAMPDVYLLDSHDHIQETLISNNLPLGIEANMLTNHSSCHRFANLESLFIYSDGIIEQMNSQQQMFDNSRLQFALEHTPTGERHIDFILESLHSYQQQQPQTDDISICEINFPRLIQAFKQCR